MIPGLKQPSELGERLGRVRVLFPKSVHTDRVDPAAVCDPDRGKGGIGVCDEIGPPWQSAYRRVSPVIFLLRGWPSPKAVKRIHLQFGALISRTRPRQLWNLRRVVVGSLGMDSPVVRCVVSPVRFDAQRAIACARRTLARYDSLIDRACERAPVQGRSRMLCAALGVLAQHAGRALGASSSLPAVTEAAALLSLLTKVDDEVIDGAAFHGGPLRRGGHRALRRRVRSYLAPSLESMRTGRPVRSEARCELAAEVGRQLRVLAATPGRLDRLHGVIASGWETQVRAVDLLSRHPAESSMAQVAHVTAAISGDWLLMITMVGGLPADARREVSDAEMEGFATWGWHIQRADALADFVKDVQEGLSNSWAGRVCFERWGEAYVRALVGNDVRALELMLDACAPACLADPSALRDATRAMDALGDVPVALSWIQAMLVGRWQSHRAQEAC